MEYPVLTIKKGKEKSLLRYHPWIFSGAVEKIPQIGLDSLVEIQDFQGNRIGYGFLEPKSQIVGRVFEFTPHILPLDVDYWKQKIISALLFKKQLIEKTSTSCFRLLHAEGDYFPGLIIDIYDQVAVVQFRISGTW